MKQFDPISLLFVFPLQRLVLNIAKGGQGPINKETAGKALQAAHHGLCFNLRNFLPSN